MANKIDHQNKVHILVSLLYIAKVIYSWLH